MITLNNNTNLQQYVVNTVDTYYTLTKLLLSNTDVSKHIICICYTLVPTTFLLYHK